MESHTLALEGGDKSVRVGRHFVNELGVSYRLEGGVLVMVDEDLTTLECRIVTRVEVSAVRRESWGPRKKRVGEGGFISRAA